MSVPETHVADVWKAAEGSARIAWAAREMLDRGKISQAQYWKSTTVAVGQAVASYAGGAGAGSFGARVVARVLGARAGTAMGAATTVAVAGGAGDVGGLGAADIVGLVTGFQTQLCPASDYLRATLVGGAMGAATAAPHQRVQQIRTGQQEEVENTVGAVSASWLDPVPAKYRTSVAQAFEGTPEVVTLSEDLIVYRHWGGEAPETGSPWFLLTPYVRPGNARRYPALPNRKPAEKVSTFKIPAGTTVIVCQVAPQVQDVRFGPYAVGGGIQIHVPNPEVVGRLDPVDVTR